MSSALAAQVGLRPDLYFNADVVKVDMLDDGTCMVYGIPAMPGVLDNDKQMVDPTWLKAALSEWFATGPNIREMHLPIAVGIGKKLDFQGDVPYLTAHIVDPTAVKKVKAGVLRAFSIGIKHQHIKRIREAVKGLIDGGKIIEVTLCDRPCIPGSDILDVKADVVKVAGYVSSDEILDYQHGLTWKATPLDMGRDIAMSDTAALEKRDIDPNVGGGVDRDKIPAEDFAGKNRSYPIVKPGDVSDAASSIGRAGDDNYSSDELKTNIIRIAKRKGAAFVAELPEAWTDNKESDKVADTDATKTPDEGDETGAATESASDKTETAESGKAAVLADLEKAAAASTYCTDCDKSMAILDGKEQTVKGNRMLVGKDSAGHTLRKFVGTDADKADAAEAEKTDEKAAEAEVAKTDAEKADAEKGVIVVAPEHKPEEAEKSADAETAKAADGDDDELDTGKAAEAETAKAVETPVASKTVDPDLAKALVTLFQDAGIDLRQIAARQKQAKLERLNAAFAEAQEILELAKSDETGGTTTLSGLSGDTAGRLRSCLAEINELAGQMTGTPADGDTSTGGDNMGTATIAQPTERITIAHYAEEPTLAKTTKVSEDVSVALDASEIAKSLAAEFTKSIEPLVERLERVEYSVKPASPPVAVAERGSPFVNSTEMIAEATALKMAQESIQGMSDDERVKVAAQWLLSRPDSPLARTA